MPVNILCYDNRVTFTSDSDKSVRADQATLHTCAFHGRKVVVNAAWRLPQVAQGIIRAAAGEKIDTLHLYAHGSTGHLQLGLPVVGGLTAETAHSFDGLKGHFGGRRMIELHGCNVANSRPIIKDILTPIPPGQRAVGIGTWADSGPGYDLLRKLASATGANVKAPLNWQYFYRSLVMTGPVAVMTPSGEVFWAGQGGWAVELANKALEVIRPSR